VFHRELVARTVTFIVKVDETILVRYYFVPSGATMLIDTVGHSNLEADRISLLDRDCSEMTEISGEFSEGGVITIDSEGTATFKRVRPSGLDLFTLRGPDEESMSHESCLDAQGR
jgi:hypothetical protein